MPRWEYWIGPLIAVVLALRLRPGHLLVLGLVALAVLVVVFNTAQQLYPDCDSGCPQTQQVFIWVNTVLLTLVPALILLGLGKVALNHWLGRESDNSASANESP